MDKVDYHLIGLLGSLLLDSVSSVEQNLIRPVVAEMQELSRVGNLAAAVTCLKALIIVCYRQPQTLTDAEYEQVAPRQSGFWPFQSPLYKLGCLKDALKSPSDTCTGYILSDIHFLP